MIFFSFFASFLLVSGLNYAKIFRNYHLRKKERSKINEIENIRDLEAKELRRLIGICLVEGIRSFECSVFRLKLRNVLKENKNHPLLMNLK